MENTVSIVVDATAHVDYIENTALFIVACWTVFTELLPGNALIKPVTIFKWISEKLNVKLWVSSVA
jgi:hypothetical protein